MRFHFVEEQKYDLVAPFALLLCPFLLGNLFATFRLSKLCPLSGRVKGSQPYFAGSPFAPLAGLFIVLCISLSSFLFMNSRSLEMLARIVEGF